MSFISFNFAVFLAFSVPLYHNFLPRWRPHLLLVLSYFFYCAWNPVQAIFLLAITGLVFLAAKSIAKQESERSKSAVATLSVASLLAILIFFKSAPWFVGLFSNIWASSGLDMVILLAAPLGLSYYLFKLLGYLLDVYWDKIPVQRNFVSLALYASFFPQILCGPIQRADDFFGQLNQVGTCDLSGIVVGLRRILFGMFKKLVIADHLSKTVTLVFQNPASFSSIELLFGAYCFAIQLYADFSGLTDMAIGVGLLFGVKGPENFNQPFYARNIQEFWRRWHISLTSWLSDYLFLPLHMALRRLGSSGLALAIILNMVAVGVWHGPTSNFAIFGLINGVFMIVSVFTLKNRNIFFKGHPRLAQVRKFAGPLVTFHLIAFSLIFFRSDSLSLALSYVGRLFTTIPVFSHSHVGMRWEMLAFSRTLLARIVCAIAVMEIVHWATRQRKLTERFLSAPAALRWGLYYAAIIIILMTAEETRTFIYAQF